MNKLLIATTNQAKFEELSAGLKDLAIKIINLKDIGISRNVIEAGNTFLENAIIKAKFYYQLSKIPTLTDDGGFEIDYLNGAPGVKSHRLVDPAEESLDGEIIDYVLTKLDKVKTEQRGAQLRLVLAFTSDGQKIYTQEEKIRGIIALTPAKKINPGFPFRSLLYLPQIKKYYNDYELTEYENKRYNHRRRAINKIKPILIKYFSREEC